LKEKIFARRFCILPGANSQPVGAWKVPAKDLPLPVQLDS
jgi:hypothetical protein